MSGRSVLSDFWRESMTEDRPPWHVICVDGDVQRPLAATVLDLSRFPQREVIAARAGATVFWQGVDIGWLLAISTFERTARFAVFHSGDRQICLPLDLISKQNAILALRAGGCWLSSDKGGPCRLVLQQGSRWRDFGGPVDRVQICIDRPATSAKSHAFLRHSVGASASAA